MREVVEEIEISEELKVSELIEKFSKTAFNARRLGESAKIFAEMLESNSFIFLTIAGAMVPAGMREIIRDMIDRGFVNALIITGANVTHEIAEALGFKHEKGEANVDDVELSRRNINRVYDIFIPGEAFEGVEKFTSKVFQELNGEYSSYELLWEIGKRLDEKSFLKSAYKKKVPIFCPTLHDSILGLHIYIYGERIRFNPIKDISKIVDLCFQDFPMGIVIIGGGVPKNFAFQAMLLSKGFDYAIQITTDSPQWGGLSGASLEEAKSWCKLKENAKTVTIYCDATIALPLLHAYVVDKIRIRNIINFEKIFS